MSNTVGRKGCDWMRRLVRCQGSERSHGNEKRRAEKRREEREGKRGERREEEREEERGGKKRREENKRCVKRLRGV